MATKTPFSNLLDKVPNPKPNPKRAATDKLRSALNKMQLDRLYSRAADEYASSLPDKTYRNFKGQVVGPKGKGI